MFEHLYVERGSIVHNLDFWTKLLTMLVVTPLATFVGPPWILVPTMAFALLLVFTSRVNLRLFWRQVRPYILVLTVAIVGLSVAFSEDNLLTRVTAGLILSARFTILIALGVLFSMVTDPLEIPVGLLRARIPHRYGVALMVGFRMMPLITKEVTNVVEIQRARGARFSLSPSDLPRLPSELMALAIPIVYSTLETSVAMSDTLLSRGYDPNAPAITIPPTRLEWRDIGFGVMSFALLMVALCSNAGLSEMAH